MIIPPELAFRISVVLQFFMMNVVVGLEGSLDCKTLLCIEALCLMCLTTPFRKTQLTWKWGLDNVICLKFCPNNQPHLVDTEEIQQNLQYEAE